MGAEHAANDMIAGAKAKQLRDLFVKSIGEATVPMPSFQLEGATLEATAALVNQLGVLGYIERVSEGKDTEPLYRLTEFGRELARTKFIKPITRKRGEEIIEQVLQRIYTFNARADTPYEISVAIVFGSMCSDKPTVHDVDVAYAYRGRGGVEPSTKKLEAYRATRSMPSFFEQLIWPQREAMKAIKGKDRYLHVQEAQAFTRMLKEDPAIRRRVIFSVGGTPLVDSLAVWTAGD